MTSTARRIRLLTCLLLIVGIVTGVSNPAGAATYQAINGNGSTWSANMINQWIATVAANGIQVTYTANGSTQGRKSFANYQNDFGVTEIPFQGANGEHGQNDTNGGRDFAYMPIVAGGTSFTYQIRVGGKLVKNLRLSGETLTKIFTGQITNWDDAAITKDNNGRKLPSLKIIPVVRSDGSGTTAQFTLWMNTQYPALWKSFSGTSTLTSFFPSSKLKNSVAQSGSDQVMNTIDAASGNGTIGYVEYSYPVNANYPVVKLLNKAGYYTAPTQYNVAVALTYASFNSDGTQNLTGVYNGSDPRTYPMSSYSYLLLPTGKSDKTMNTAKRQTLADFLSYSLCQGQQTAGSLGYSPLPLNLVQAGMSKIALLKKADSKVDVANTSLSKCNNPTFVAGNLKANHLAQVAPKPQTCDKVGQGPCGDNVVGGSTGKAGSSGSGTTSGGKGTSGSASGTGSGSTGTAATGDGSGAATAAKNDPASGAATGTGTGDTTSAAAAGSAAVPLDLASSRTGDRTAFGVVAAAELLAVIVLPGLIAMGLRRRRGRA